jgi:hypothetical protein
VILGWLRHLPVTDVEWATDTLIDAARSVDLLSAISTPMAQSAPRPDPATGELIRALAAGPLPDHGGDRPQVIVTLDYPVHLCHFHHWLIHRKNREIRRDKTTQHIHVRRT